MTFAEHLSEQVNKSHIKQNILNEMIQAPPGSIPMWKSGAVIPKAIQLKKLEDILIADCTDFFDPDLPPLVGPIALEVYFQNALSDLKAGKTSKEIAKEHGISPTLFSRFEKKPKMPSAFEMRELEKVFGAGFLDEWIALNAREIEQEVRYLEAEKSMLRSEKKTRRQQLAAQSRAPLAPANWNTKLDSLDARDRQTILDMIDYFYEKRYQESH